MKLKLKAHNGDEYIGKLNIQRVAEIGVIEMNHRLFVYSHVGGGAAWYHEATSKAIPISEFDHEPKRRDLRVGDGVKLIAVHREEDRPYIGQLATITDGSGILTDFVITFGNGHFIGANKAELEPA